MQSYDATIEYKETKSEDSVQKQQRDLLIRAINDYLTWRSNKTNSGGRIYALGIFTKLRHFTKFGEIRATNLRRSLLQDADPIKTLQNHFKNNSHVDNHSLDTFLLEAIASNKHLFLVRDEVTVLQNKKQRKALRKVVAEQKTITPPEYAYKVAKLYEESKEAKDGMEKAFFYYTLAVRLNHEAAFGILKKLADHGNSDAQYVIGFDYYHRQYYFTEAINWCLRAAEQGHVKAIAYLADTPFSADHYLTIAKRYDQGDGVVKNTKTAIIFYKKACTLNNKHAAYRLGQLYYPVSGESKGTPAGLERKEQSKEMLQAFEYYFIAAKQRDEASLKAMELITEQTSDGKLKFKLGQAYFDGFGNHLSALKIFKELADRNDLAAIQHISALAKNNAECALIVGKLYEENAKGEEQLLKSCVYYIIATQHKQGGTHSTLAKTYLERFRNSKQLTIKNLTLIGQKYVSGSDGILRDYIEARRWFEKSSELGCEVAHYELGNLYQLALGVTKDLSEAARYYQLAVNKGHALAKGKLDALLASREIPLAGLIAIAPFNSEAEYMIGVDHYHRQHNIAEAINWCLRAAERGHAKATAYLTDTSFSADHYLTIAKRYDQGDRVVKNTNTAITFYKKACALNNKHAAFRLGQLHYGVLDENKSAPAGLETKGSPKEQSTRMLQAFEYYFIAAKQRDEASLKAMELIAAQVGDDKLKFKLAQAYLDGFGHHLSALKIFKELAEQNDAASAQQLQVLSKSNTEYALTVGKLYEENAKSKDHLLKACVYYIIATQHKRGTTYSELAKTHLERICNSDQLTTKDLNTFAQRYCKGDDEIEKDYVKARQWFEKASERGCELAHYELGNLYQLALGVTKDLSEAARHYQLAVNKGHALAKGKLDALLASREIPLAGLIAIAPYNSEAEYMIGVDHYHRQHNFAEAINWCLRAAERGHAKATAYLTDTSFSADHYLTIAKRYDQGDRVVKNTNTAITFYKKACALNNKHAAFRLGQLHYAVLDEIKSAPAGLETKEPSKEQSMAVQQAFDYYFIAAKQGDDASLKAMELIAEQASDNKLKFKLGQAYLDGFGNHLSALKFFKELADQNDLAAVQHLQTLAKNKTEYAFTVGKLYEENAKSEEHFIKACVYYIIATQHKQSDIFSASAVTYLERLGNSFELTAKNLTTIGQKYSCGIDGVIRDYVEARRWFVKACEKGCAVAHYELANLYQAALGVTKDDGQAARFYQLAYNKGYALAKEKLDSLLDSREISSAGLIAIASIYQSGADGIEKDWPRVASLYQRAAERGDKVAALHLGQFYQIDHVGVKRNITLAFHFYLQAAKLGNHEALNPLERLAEEVSSDQQLALSQAYASFFHKPEKSIYWREKSREVQEFKFIS